jgi:hypothetical protein
MSIVNAALHGAGFVRLHSIGKGVRFSSSVALRQGGRIAPCTDSEEFSFQQGRSVPTRRIFVVWH